MAKSVVYTCDATGITEADKEHPATLQVITHSRHESTIYSIATRHTCNHHIGVVVDMAYTTRTDEVSRFNKKSSADPNPRNRVKDTRFADIIVSEIPANER